MAALTTDQVSVVFQDGVCGRMALLSCKRVSAGDTFDVGPSGVGVFREIKRGGFVSDTGSTIAAFTFSGTVLTVPAGPSNDGIWGIVIGVAI